MEPLAYGVFQHVRRCRSPRQMPGGTSKPLTGNTNPTGKSETKLSYTNGDLYGAFRRKKVRTMDPKRYTYRWAPYINN